MNTFALTASRGVAVAISSGRSGSTPRWNRKSTSEVPLIMSAFAAASAGSNSGGLVFGMSMTVVTPPATAARLPWAQSSL